MPCLRVSRGGQSRRRRASRSVRSLFRGTWSSTSSLGKLDPGPYRRVSEPRARRVAPAASMSGRRQAVSTGRGPWAPAPAALGSGSGCGQSPMRGGSPRPWPGTTGTGSSGRPASGPRRCSRELHALHAALTEVRPPPHPGPTEALAPGQLLQRNVWPFVCMFRFSHVPQILLSGKGDLKDAVSA